MKDLRPWLSLLRFEEYGPLFILCTIAGALLARGGFNLELLYLVVFVATLSASAFVGNDIVDMNEDGRRKVTRNPLSRGELTKDRAIYALIVLAAISVGMLLFIGSTARFLALLSFGLFWGYSWGPKFKSIPIIDVLVHGSAPAVLMLMGYLIFEPISVRVLLVSSVVFFFAAMTAILQQLRDHDPDRDLRSTTVSLLGNERSVDLALSFSLAGIGLFALLALTEFLPRFFLAFLPFGYPILRPLLGLRQGVNTPVKAILQIRSRGLVLSIVIMLAYMLL